MFYYAVPAIPHETLSLLQESSDSNDALDYFQSVNVEIPQNIQEITQATPEAVEDILDYEAEDLDDIPDMEDFDNQNLLITDDPVTTFNILFYQFQYFVCRLQILIKLNGMAIENNVL